MPETFDRSKAEDALRDRGGGHPSVYTVENEQIADRVMTVFAMSGKPQPEDVNYLIIPADWLESVGITIAADPGDIPHQLLKDTHGELVGLDDPVKVDELMAKFANETGASGKKIKKQDLISLATVETRNDQTGVEACALIDGKKKWEQCLPP